MCEVYFYLLRQVQEVSSHPTAPLCQKLSEGPSLGDGRPACTVSTPGATLTCWHRDELNIC